MGISPAEAEQTGCMLGTHRAPQFTDRALRTSGMSSRRCSDSTAPPSELQQPIRGGWRHQSQRSSSSQSQSGAESLVSFNRWRPKRASDRLLLPDATPECPSPQKKKKASPHRVSVDSLDSLAELRGEGHAGNLSSSAPGQWDSEEKKKRNSSSSGSDQTSEDDAASVMSPRRRSLDRGAWLGSQMDDVREKERKRWREFRGRKTSGLRLHLKKPRNTPTEPIVLSTEEEEDKDDEGHGASQSRVEEPEKTKTSKEEEDENNPPPLPPPFLQLDFVTLHAGLTHANGRMVVRNNQKNKKSNLKLSGLQRLPTRLIQYPASPCKGRITVTKEDLACLSGGEFLNDVIIDFYLKFLLLERAGGSVAERSHVFSSFFYKQLSRRRDDGAPSVPDRHMRHQRVKTWTRHVDIFTKDFLFVPVNQEAHWFLVVVCFPGLEEVQYQEFQRLTGGPTRPAGNLSSFSLRSQQPPECTQQSWQRDMVMKRPCVLVMDSLKLSYHDNVCRFLREYLQVEWEVRRGTPRLFTADSVKSCSCRVPQQDNSSDCGLYLLQYAESFLQNPVVHFELPMRLDNWFPRQRVRQKREEIRTLIMKMHRSQTGT